jgi:hypothetical protein
MRPPDITHWLERLPYSMPAEEKKTALTAVLRSLTDWHREACPAYAKIVAAFGNAFANDDPLESLPFIPARLFKEMDLTSVPDSSVYKRVTSSATMSHTPARIAIDRETADLQSRVLARLVADLVGDKRLPMLVIDAPCTASNREAMSARAAGIRGFSMFGRDVTYALNDQMQIDLPNVIAFLDRHAGKQIFLFGFTIIVWKHFYGSLVSQGLRIPIESGVLLHGGGWKKLADEAVSEDAFRAAMADTLGIRRVVNYYGMAEQTGSLFMECEHGRLHAPIYADVLIRDPVDFGPAQRGCAGIIEVMSLLPRSYPGHILLTEDMGQIDGEDDCACGRLGKYFRVLGRIPQAEPRGCSDTYEHHT